MPRFSLEKISDANRDVIFEIFTNFENYQRLIPQHFPSIRVRSVRDNVSIAEEHFVLGGMELCIMAKHVSKSPVLHEVFVIGGDAKGSHITQEFLEHGKGCKILVDVDLKLKGRMQISRILLHNDLKRDYDRLLDSLLNAHP